LGEIGHRLGRTALADVANAALPDTVLGWYRRLVARKFNGSKTCRGVGRPRVTSDLEQLIVKMARENPGWGYDRIVGALANLGHEISDQTVGNILKRHSVPTAPERKHTTNWADFIRAHMAVLTLLGVEKPAPEHEVTNARKSTPSTRSTSAARPRGTA
jgi:putative transposase